jgi:hypothetical protein
MNSNNCKALTVIYPDYAWNYQKKEKVARGYWKSLDNQRAFIEDLAKKLSILYIIALCC